MSIRLAKGIGVALIVGLLVLVASFTLVRRRAAPPVPDSDTLDYVKHLVWLNNWADAAERLSRMEARSALPRDEKTTVFCSAVRLRGRVESGRLADVAEQLRALLATREAIADPELRLLVLSALGDVLFQYDLQGAESIWQQASRLASERRDSVWAARADGELGTIAFLNGHVVRALQLVSSAALKAEANGDTASRIRYSTALGEGLGKFGRKPDATKFFDRALRLYRENPGAYFPFTAFVGKARLLAEAGKASEAEQMLERELATSRERGYRVREARILATLGDLLDGSRPKDAYEDLKQAADIAAAAGMYRIESDVTTKLADVALRLNGASGALPYANRSVDAAERAGDTYALPQKLAVVAEVQAASGQTKAADCTFAKASKLIDELVQTVPYSKDKSTLIGAMGRVFVGHFELSVLQLNDPAKAFHVLEAARARGLLEVIRSSRKGNVPLGSTINSTQLVALQTRLTSESNPATRRSLLDRLWETEVRSFKYRAQQPVDLPTPEPVRLRDLQSILKPQEIILEYVLGQDRSFALEIGRRHVKSYVLPPRRLIEGAVEHYIATAKDLGDVAQQARQLYQMLLAPISGAQSARRIVIVPDGALHGLPFDALVDASGALLVSRAVISYAPSASVNFLLSRAVHGQHCHRGKELLAVGGVSYGGDQATDKLRMALRSGNLFEADASPTLAALPGASKEIAAITPLAVDGADALTGDSATETAVKAANLAQYRAIHFAVHASIDEQFPDRSALRLAKNSGPGQDGLLQAREVLSLPLNANLVTLSACDAGSGRVEGLAGMNSLVQAFLMAGAKTVVASTWAAEDNATAELMRNFYQHLKNGADKAEALTLAKRDLLAKYGSNAQPFLWAGFRLVGDPHGTIEGD
ncbi:MAG: CHAT domain-containing protein [Acidobacteria bacterium]|nr:CHAT domain-containing protein [Acidobacteriota bacterium]